MFWPRFVDRERKLPASAILSGFLLGFAFWFWALYSPFDGFFGIACDGIFAAIIAGFTCEFVAIALMWLFKPIRAAFLYLKKRATRR